jgi:hypothetical protein
MEVLLNERVSMERPAWTSTPETGGFKAYNHKHVEGAILRDYYKNREIKFRPYFGSLAKKKGD